MYFIVFIGAEDTVLWLCITIKVVMILKKNKIVMAKYIPLDAVLAEIEKLVDLRKFKTDYDYGYRNGGNAALNNLKERINSIKAKEVDINKEISQFIDANFEKATIGHKLSLRRVAKHFFDLGMRVSNPITAEDRGMAEEIIINLKRVEQDYHINLTKEIEWVRNQVKKENSYGTIY